MQKDRARYEQKSIYGYEEANSVDEKVFERLKHYSAEDGSYLRDRIRAGLVRSIKLYRTPNDTSGHLWVHREDAENWLKGIRQVREGLRLTKEAAAEDAAKAAAEAAAKQKASQEEDRSKPFESEPGPAMARVRLNSPPSQEQIWPPSAGLIEVGGFARRLDEVIALEKENNAMLKRIMSDLGVECKATE